MHAHEAQDLQIYAPLCTKVVLRWKWPATPMYKFLFYNRFSHRFISPDFPNQIDPSATAREATKALYQQSPPSL